MYLADLKRKEPDGSSMQYVIDAWPRVLTFVTDWEQPQWQLEKYQLELPEMLVKALRERHFAGSLQ